MKLEVRNGKVVWVNKDGSLSKQSVSGKAALDFCGFPVLVSGKNESVQILAGNPMKNDILLVRVLGSSWSETALLSKTTEEYVGVREEDISYAKELVDNPPQGAASMEDLVEQERQRRRDAVDVEQLAQRKGLEVWEARYFDGYWCRECGEFNDLPEGWYILPTGDAAFTRKVRQGPHWILKRAKREYSVVVGTTAPLDNIESAFEELGGKETAARRRKSKKRGQEKREQRIAEQLNEAIARVYPNMPEEDREEVLERCRRSGAVGTSSLAYFGEGGRVESLELVARLAVRAHVRHQYTDYDGILSESQFGDEDARWDARAAVAGRIRNVLAEWE